MKKLKTLEQSVSLKKNYRSIRMYEIEQVLDEKLSYDPIRNSDTLATVARNLIGNKDQENFLVIALNSKNEVIGIHIAHVRQLNSSLMHFREIFKILIMCNAASYALAHNHPSGTTVPSEEDVQATVRIIDAGHLIGIPLIDHVIVSKDFTREYSIRKHSVIHGLNFSKPSTTFTDPRSLHIL
ncbi:MULTISPECIES: JAB domain-containing protein [unclassified Exiguobacterium]|uniref:JAB domain-containing protein n=1 Tax=unclassified Exiguobacterium TaxID=2644629 RepID=UPI001BE88821|nr:MULTISPECIES: JAB domain-containing protein [unclassified Exiguobacterium]